MALTSEPTAAVTVTVSVPAGTDVSASPAALTFTAAAWQAAQTVTVSAAEDDDAVGDDPVTLTHAVSSSGDYAGEPAASVTVTIAESDTATLTLTLSPESVSENNGETMVTAALSHSSGADTTITVSATPVATATGGDFTQSGSTLTIAAGSTTSTGTVTITAVDDDVHAADKQVTVSATASNGIAAPEAVTLTITDDDTRGVTVSPTALTVAEGGSNSYEVALSSEPTAEVTVDVGVPAGTDVSASPPALTFTAASWRTAQTVTVSAAEDGDALVDAPVTVTHTVSGGDYAAVTAASVTVTSTENDRPVLSISDRSAAESAGMITFVVTPSMASSEQVTVSYETADGSAASGTGGDYTAAIGTLTFPAAQHGGTDDQRGVGRRRGGRRRRDVHGDTEGGAARDAGRGAGDAGGDRNDHGRRCPWGDGVGEHAGVHGGRQCDLHGGAELAADGGGDGKRGAHTGIGCRRDRVAGGADLHRRQLE